MLGPWCSVPVVFQR